MNIQSRILIIEDDNRFAKTISNVLALQNFEVCYANNGAEGIQKAFEFNPDLILCDIRMEPIDGYQVYNVLKETSIIDRIPFIFMSGCSDLQELRFGLDLGADDYFIKPLDNESLVKSIEKRLAKYKKLKDIGKREFKILFELSPNGIFLFNEDGILDANQALIKFFGLDASVLNRYYFQDILDLHSYEKIQDKIIKCSRGLIDYFSEKVTVISSQNEKDEITLYVSVYEKYTGHSIMLGLLILQNNLQKSEKVSFTDIKKLLKKENIFIPNSLNDKLNDIFQNHILKTDSVSNDFFSERENQVLCLSMEGLSIKMIADKLSISDRTVEKHRAKLMEKTNSNNIIEAIIFALRNNLIEM